MLVAVLGALLALQSTSDADFFEKKIRPVLVERCYSCHSVPPNKRKGGLLLDWREGILKGGDTGPAGGAADPAPRAGGAHALKKCGGAPPRPPAGGGRSRPPLDGRRPLRRLDRLRRRLHARRSLEIPGLPDRRVQPGQALRRVRA